MRQWEYCSVGVAMKGWNEQERKTKMNVGEELGLDIQLQLTDILVF